MTDNLKEVCPQCKNQILEYHYGGERGEAGPFLYCSGCGYDEENIKKIGPMKLIATTDMRIVSMIEFHGKIYLACEYGVFIHDPKKGDFDFQQMQLVCLPPEKTK